MKRSRMDRGTSTLKRSAMGPKSFADAVARANSRQSRPSLSRKGGTPVSPNEGRIANHGQHKPRKPMKQHRAAIKGTVKDLERQLDDLTRQVLRQDERVCFTDGKRGTADDPLQVSHLFGRSQRPTRFDVHVDGNNHMMHASCNSRHNDDKSIYRNAFIARFSQEAYDEIERRAHQEDKRDYITLLGMIEQRESMLQ